MILEFEALYVEMNEGSSSSQVVVTPSHSEFISDTQISTSTETMQSLASSPSASDLPRSDPKFSQQHSKKEKGVSTECSVQTEPVEQTPKEDSANQAATSTGTSETHSDTSFYMTKPVTSSCRSVASER